MSVLLLVSSVARADDRPPLPADASAPMPTKGGGERLGQYTVERDVAAVLVEERKLLKDGGWKIVKDEPAPSTSATRLQVKKAGGTWRISLSGDKTRTVIVLTSPAAQ